MQQHHTHSSYDLILLGGGSGGLTAARLAASLGARTLLVEKERLGGECLHSGCVPSKSLIHLARLIHQARQVQRCAGQSPSGPIDMEYVATSIQEVIEQIRETERAAVEGVTVRFGHAAFQSPSTLLLDGETINGQAVVIATGSHPAIPAISGLAEAGFLTNETVFDLKALPASLAILGGGPQGCELGQAFARLGSRVTIIQRAERLLPREDPQVSQAITTALHIDGVHILTNSQVTQISMQGTQRILTIRQGGQAQPLSVEAILLATGRQPNMNNVHLEAADIACNESGIVVDRFLRTSAPTVYAIGDVIGGAHFSHVAAAQAGIAVRNALVPFGKQRYDARVIPWCTFTSPEAGRIGLTEAEARQRYKRVRVVAFPAMEIDRAQTDQETAGFLKLVLAGTREEIVGAHLVGAHVGELLGELALAMRQRLPLSALLATIHPYPTWSTGLQQLAFEAYIQGQQARHHRTLVRAWLALRQTVTSVFSRSSQKKEQL